MEFPVEECAKFKELVLELNKSEQKEVSDKKIESVDDLVSLLLKRVATKNLDTLASIFKSSLTPSINIELDENLAKFSIKIGNSPSLMFEEDIQKEMQSYITKRFEADQNIVKQKTEDIAKLVTLMGKYLNDAISSSGSGSDNVSNIKDKIESLDMSTGDLKELSVLQSKLVSAALSIENEMSAVGAKFKDGKSQVSKLEQKIQKLEEELDSAKKESTIDHLTGLLTRRAFDEEIQRIEGLYQRNGTQYALIFFDIDHFKNVNDTFGHEGGDVILKTFAKVLQKETRENDIVCRYGGEEFVAIIHFNLKRELLKYLKRIKNIITQNKFLYKEHKIEITFSAGTTLRNQYESYTNALQKSDLLLYEAKESGRNKIIIDDGTII
ncbi:GGDEF domain-containing protein [Arcobacter sp. 31_11_sub10_T18]|nr:GGDEF domain-containing protein [Arcobacter sp. 31_11_sub10_T18]